MSSVDKLWKLYTNNVGPIVWARSVGVEVLNEWSGLKEAVMRFAGSDEDSMKPSGAGSDSHTPLGVTLPGILAAAVENVSGALHGARTLIGATNKRMENQYQPRQQRKSENSTLTNTSTDTSPTTVSVSRGNALWKDGRPSSGHADQKSTY
ncbi:putative ubiquinone biosynthesis monooxygenase [Serendipita sp. 399]|nr:putative ubiquinone biosynthesis monooxygenase [Serendipita sp. 399]